MPGRSNPRKLTYQDYLRFPSDGRRHEIIDGVHYVTPPPVLVHQRIAASLFLALGNFVRRRQLGEAYFAPVAVLLSPHDVVEPDLLFISTARLDIQTRTNVQGAPNLVIEILSPSTRRRDEVLKRARYERFGADEYWLVDPLSQSVRILRRSGGDVFEMLDVLTAADGQIVTTPLLPALEIPVAEIFT
jgi:Uma2 family endonuclease